MLHQIGSGVLGPVFRSFDPQRDRIVAVKAFKLELLPEDVARLADALRRLAAASFTHPHHVALIDAGLEGTTPYLVTEYVSGETLDVARRQLTSASASATLPWLRQLADAIDEAHQAGWLHGSLHPRDVLIAGRSGDARVTGFGIAAALESVGLKPPVRRPYTAPERTSGEPWNSRADIYSLAAVAHELLTGRRPAGPGEQDGSLSNELTPEQRVAVRKVLSTGLAERPELRFETAGALIDALGSAVSIGQAGLPFAAPVVAVPAPEPVTPAPVSPEPVSEPVSENVEAASVVDEPALETEPHDVDLMAAAPNVAEPSATEPGPQRVEDTHEVFIAATLRSFEDRVKSSDTPIPSAALGGSSSSIFAEPPAARSSYPWAAIAAVAVACLVGGGAIGYMLGADQPAPAIPTASVPPPAPPPTPDQRDTEVAVVPEPQTKPPAVAAPGAVESTAERAAAPTGQLAIRSTPTGALVTVDGRYRGETPVTIRDLPLGAHAVQIARPGHVPWSEQVTLTAGSPARAVNAELQPGLDVAGQNVGAAYVDSRPRGARVLVDGKLVGTTPFRVPGLTGGRHVIRVELEGYRSVSVPVTITPGRESRVAMTLEPAAAWPGGYGPTR